MDTDSYCQALIFMMLPLLMFQFCRWALKYWVETCVCDTPLCNEPFGRDVFDVSSSHFFCYLGDFDLAYLEESTGDAKSVETISCTNNREQCMAMKYSGRRSFYNP